MNENDFPSNKTTETGKLVWEPQGMYFRFEPHELPLNFKEMDELRAQSYKTLMELSRLDGIASKFGQNEIKLFQILFFLKEAQLSSEIEGIRSTISDVLKGEKIKEKNPEKKLDNEEIANYLETLIWTSEKLPAQMTEALILKMHKKLLRGVRGSAKSPGRYKSEQNGIGSREDTLDSAKFVPASPQSTPRLMKNLVDYSNSKALVPLYKIGILHYQFEAVHPFRDGNGRLGRMLIVLELFREKILRTHLIYISEYLTRNRDRYVELLYQCSSRGDINEWLLFFLKALEVQAKKSFELMNKIDDYKRELHDSIGNFSPNPNIHAFVDSLFSQPFFTIQDTMKILGLSQPAVRKLVNRLADAGIVEQLPAKSRKEGYVYCAKNVLRILEGK